MYTTADAVRLLLRSRYSDVELTTPVWASELDEVTTLVDLGLLMLHSTQKGDRVEHSVSITDLGRIVVRETQQHFEELLSKARRASDLRRTQRTLALGSEGSRS